MKPVSGMISDAVRSSTAAADMKRLHKTRQREEEQRQERTLKPVKDEYVPEEKKAVSGRYWLTRGEDGTFKVRFDDPARETDALHKQTETSDKDGKRVSQDGGKKADDPGDDEKPKGARKKSADKKAETCTGNTDKVDREIRKLKQKKKELERQVRSETDEAKARKLAKELAQVESELRQKDNDGYRRQHTEFH